VVLLLFIFFQVLVKREFVVFEEEVLTLREHDLLVGFIFLQKVSVAEVTQS